MRIVPMTCGNINADELAEVIRRLSHDDPVLVDLTMSWSNLGDSGLNKVADAIRYNNHLVDLDVYSNNVTSAGLVRLGAALEYVWRVYTYHRCCCIRAVRAQLHQSSPLVTLRSFFVTRSPLLAPLLFTQLKRRPTGTTPRSAA